MRDRALGRRAVSSGDCEPDAWPVAVVPKFRARRSRLPRARHRTFAANLAKVVHAARTRHEREGREEDTRPAPPSSPPKVKHNYLDLLIRKQQQNIERRSSGIDYREVLAAADRRWPFAEFAKQLAANLGRSGGLSAFRADATWPNMVPWV